MYVCMYVVGCFVVTLCTFYGTFPELKLVLTLPDRSDKLTLPILFFQNRVSNCSTWSIVKFQPNHRHTRSSPHHPMAGLLLLPVHRPAKRPIIRWCRLHHNPK